jgi:hypothetical protein
VVLVEDGKIIAGEHYCGFSNRMLKKLASPLA